MADSYTDADRTLAMEAVAKAWGYGSVDEADSVADGESASLRRTVDAVLAALAGAGRLLPDDTRTEYGVRWHDTSVVVDGYVRETAVAVGAQYEHAEAVQRRVGPWVPVPGPVVGAGMDVAGQPTAGAQTYAPDTQTGPAGVPEEKTR